MVTVYGLIDPRYDEVRYVGVTTLTAKRRLSYHVSRAKKNVRTHRDAWIKGLLLEGLVPGVVVLQEVQDAEAGTAERRWISKFENLTNCSEGGESLSTGWKHSSETKQKIAESLASYQESVRSEICDRGHQITGIKVRSNNGRTRRFCKECKNMNERKARADARNHIHLPGPVPVS